MKILPIDFDNKNALQTISDWVDEWSVERYGEESLKPEYYYNQSDDGRYLFGVKHNEEHATIERVRELLLKIYNINYKLSDEGQLKHLTYDERERLKAERQDFYDEYVRIVSTALIEEDHGGGEKPDTLIEKTQSDERGVEKFAIDNIKALQDIYQDECIDATKMSFYEFVVMCENADFTKLLKQAPDGHWQISNQVCRVYYKIWKVLNGKEVKNKWKLRAAETLSRFKPKKDWWNYITKKGISYPKRLMA